MLDMLLYNITLVFLVVFTLLLVGFRFWRGARFDEFSKDQTLPLRGLLVLFVVVGHCDTMMPGSVLLSMLHLGTPAVSVFLFLSGYGLVKLVDRTDGRIGLVFFVHSFVKLFVPFAVAVLLWYVYLLCSGKQCETAIYWFPTTGGGTFLPHAWYVYVQLLFYVMFGICVLLLRGRRGIWMAVGGVAAYYVFMRYFSGWRMYWSYTSLGFSAGLLFAYYEDVVLKFARQYGWVCCIVTAAVFLLSFVGSRAMKCPISLDLRLTLVGPVVGLLLVSGITWWTPKRLGKIAYEVYLLHCIPKDYFLGMTESHVIYCFMVVVSLIALAGVVHELNKKLMDIVLRGLALAGVGLKKKAHT